MADNNLKNNTSHEVERWIILRFVLSWSLNISCLGVGVLFVYLELIYLHPNFFQIFNPLLHFKVILELLNTRFFWIFLALAILGYYATLSIDEKLKKSDKSTNSNTKKFKTKSPPINQETKHDTAYNFSDNSKNNQINLIKWAIQSSQKIQFNYQEYNGNNSNYIVTPINTSDKIRRR